jgi:hypothetical protein
MIVRRVSSLSGNVHEMDLDITDEQIRRYAVGGFAQDVFPHLTAGEREFIMTGITPTEWAEVFGEDE